MPSVQTPSLAKLKPLGDAELTAHLQAGCNDALSILLDRYHRLILSIALRIVRDQGEAEDVLQTVFLEIFRSVAQFEPAKGSTKGWILQYAYHRAFNRSQHLNARSFYKSDRTWSLSRIAGDPFCTGRLKQSEL